MRRVEKDFHKPPPELKTCARKYKKIFLDGNEDEAVQSKCYKKAGEALGKLYHGKCAYCEISIGAGAYTRIDHYRPKSIYKWLAVEWSNLVPSCEVCNTKKKDHFPLPEGVPMATKGEPESEDSPANSKVLLDENPLLLHPELDEPRHHLEFETNGRIKGKDGSSRGKKTIEVCNLNRDDLLRERKSQIDGILGSIQFFSETIIVIKEKKPEVYYRDEVFWLCLYSKSFRELRKLQEPGDQRAFTLLGLCMYEKFEYFIIRGLPENEAMRDIVRKAFMLFKEGKLEACHG